jgi:hypothetical protein
MQFELDKAKPAHKRAWLRCDVDEDGHHVVVVLATREMIADAIKYGHGRPLFMDATHGLQKYGLKLVTVLVKDASNRGRHSLSASQGNVGYF